MGADMKRIVALILVLLLAASVMTGCIEPSDDPADTGTNDTGVDPRDTETDTEPGPETDTGDTDTRNPDTETDPPENVEIEIAANELKLNIGQAFMPDVSVKPEKYSLEDLEWSSSDAGVARFSPGEGIIAEGEGKCVITVSLPEHDGASRTINVTVLKNEVLRVERVSLDRYVVNLTVGLSDMPWVTMYPENATDKGEIWSSDNPAVAVVNYYGNITGVGAGTCTVTVRSSDNPEAEAKVTVNVSELKVFTEVTYIDGILVANKTYGLPRDYNPGVDPEAMAALQEMFDGAAADGITLWIVSGFRSYDTQYTIYNNYVARDGQGAADRYSARPGHSEHQTGLAFDLNSLEQSFGETAEGKWLKAHSWEYGFIIRYPEGKEDITGYMYEPWHVRYFGKEVAKSLYDSGLTLEEYLGITSEY